MKRATSIFSILILLLVYPSQGQVIGFNASEKAGSVSTADLRTYFQMVSMVFGSSHINTFIETGKKGNAGLSVMYPVSFSDSKTSSENRGIVPIFFLNFKVSDNLYLTGSMTSLNDGSNIAQILSYGINVKLGNPDLNAPGIQWKRTTVSGLRDFRITTTDFMFSRSFNFLSGLRAGVGTTLFKINTFSPLEPFFDGKYESSRGYIQAGYELSSRGVTFFPMVRINSEHAQMGMDISLEF